MCMNTMQLQPKPRKNKNCHELTGKEINGKSNLSHRYTVDTSSEKGIRGNVYTDFFFTMTRKVKMQASHKNTIQSSYHVHVYEAFHTIIRHNPIIIYNEKQQHNFQNFKVALRNSSLHPCSQVYCTHTHTLIQALTHYGEKWKYR